MASVTMSDEVGVVLVKPHLPFRSDLLVPAAHTLAQNTFSRLVLGNYITEARALRRRVLRMRVIIVESRSVAEHKVAFDLLKTQRTIFVELVIGRFIGILHQGLSTESARIEVGILQFIVPLHQCPMLGVAPHKFYRLGHYIDRFDSVYRYPVFRFDAENPLHSTQGASGDGPILNDMRRTRRFLVAPDRRNLDDIL